MRNTEAIPYRFLALSTFYRILRASWKKEWGGGLQIAHHLILMNHYIQGGIGENSPFPGLCYPKLSCRFSITRELVMPTPPQDDWVRIWMFKTSWCLLCTLKTEKHWKSMIRLLVKKGNCCGPCPQGASSLLGLGEGTNKDKIHSNFPGWRCYGDLYSGHQGGALYQV